MIKFSKLKPEEEKDLSKVINNYIASHTSDALSKLLSEPIKYNVMILDKEFFNLDKIKLAPDEIQMCAVRISGKGDTHIEICYAIKMKYAKLIAAKLLSQEKMDAIDEMGSSAIQEVANIMTGSFFNAMSSVTGFRVELSTPDYLQGDLNTIVNDSAKNVMTPQENGLIADAELVGEKSGIRIHMLIMQNTKDARKLLLNHIEKSDSSEFSTIVENYELDDIVDATHSQTYDIGSESPELDALIEELSEKSEVNDK